MLEWLVVQKQPPFGKDAAHNDVICECWFHFLGATWFIWVLGWYNNIWKIPWWLIVLIAIQSASGLFTHPLKDRRFGEKWKMFVFTCIRLMIVSSDLLPRNWSRRNTQALWTSQNLYALGSLPLAVESYWLWKLPVCMTFHVDWTLGFIERLLANGKQVDFVDPC